MSNVKSSTEGQNAQHMERLSLTTDANTVLAPRGWYLSSGSTVHACNSRDMFVDYQPLSGQKASTYFNDLLDVAGIGTVIIRFTTGKVLTLRNVFHVPTIRACILSPCKLGDVCISMGAEGVSITKNNEIVGKGYADGGLYRLSIVE